MLLLLIMRYFQDYYENGYASMSTVHEIAQENCIYRGFEQEAHHEKKVI